MARECRWRSRPQQNAQKPNKNAGLWSAQVNLQRISRQVHQTPDATSRRRYLVLELDKSGLLGRVCLVKPMSWFRLDMGCRRSFPRNGTGIERTVEIPRDGIDAIGLWFRRTVHGLLDVDVTAF